MLRSNMTQRTEKTPMMSPTTYVWTIYLHPSLSVCSVEKQGDWLIHRLSLPLWWVQEHKRKLSAQYRFNMGTVHSERPFDMSENDSLAWNTAGSYGWNWRLEKRNPKGIPWQVTVVNWTFNLHSFHPRQITYIVYDVATNHRSNGFSAFLLMYFLLNLSLSPACPSFFFKYRQKRNKTVYVNSPEPNLILSE